MLTFIYNFSSTDFFYLHSTVWFFFLIFIFQLFSWWWSRAAKNCTLWIINFFHIFLFHFSLKSHECIWYFHWLSVDYLKYVYEIMWMCKVHRVTNICNNRIVGWRESKKICCVMKSNKIFMKFILDSFFACEFYACLMLIRHTKELL